MAGVEQGPADGVDVAPDIKAIEREVAGRRLRQNQEQVNEVAGVMKDNVTALLERDVGLGDLERRGENLNVETAKFGALAGKLKRKNWWKNCKMMIILGIVVALVLVVGGVWIAQKTGYLSGSSDNASDAEAPAATASPKVDFSNDPAGPKPGDRQRLVTTAARPQ